MKRHYLTIFILSILFIFNSFQSNSQGISLIQQRKLINALNIISNMYVDSVNDKKLVETAIVSMLKELDPHSVYIPKEEVERINEPLEGSFEGIGIQFQMFQDTLLVVQTIAGCPAEKVGIRPGDRIIYVDEKLIAGVKMQNSDIMKLLRGPRGTEVTVKVLRRGEPELLIFKIVRDKIPLYSVDANYLVKKDIGYIKINNFGSSTAAEFRKALTELQKKGMKHLILSLQGNGGGYLGTAIQLADEFLEQGKLIVYTQGLRQSKKEWFATSHGEFEKGKLIVLVDEYSASASEIVSGALQDWDRAIIIGRRTFGKGLVQQQIPLNDGSMIRLTTARYYTPTGRCIQKPYKDGVDKYEQELLNRYKKGELLHADSVHFPDSLRYQTLVFRRTVYGGGGIMPDIFVPLDTTRYTDYHQKLVARGVLNKVYVQYIDQHRNELTKNYSSFEKYKNDFEVDNALLQQLIKEGKKEQIPYNEAQFNTSKELVKLQLKALIARDLWDVNAYYQIMDVENSSLQKAIEILETPGAYEKILQ